MIYLHWWYLFFIWTHGEDKFKRFLEHLNSFDSNLKFNHEPSKKSLPFLDLKVKLSKGKIITDLYVKDTDRHQHLHHTSSHPNNTQWSTVYSQAFRAKMICSIEEDFEQHIHETRSWFQERACPNKILDEKLVKVRFSNQENTWSKKSKGILLVVTYHPLLQMLNNIIKNPLTSCMLTMSWEKYISPGPKVSFRGACKLSSYLVRAKVYPLESKIESCGCGGKRCQVIVIFFQVTQFFFWNTELIIDVLEVFIKKWFSLPTFYFDELQLLIKNLKEIS